MSIKLRLAYHYFFPPQIEAGSLRLLEELSQYYKRLSIKEQKRFARRVSIFLKVMSFYSPDKGAITEEMRILIASAAIQLTFGLKRYIFRFFRKIIIQPGLYHIPEFKEKLLGHVDKSRRTITLSWPNSKFGFLIPDDAHNVVLHELSHTILFENSLRSQFDEFFTRVNWENWLDVAEDRYIKNQNKANIILSEYADKNLLEMFSVSVETFFEQSEKLQKHLPRLYAALVKLLQQDPVKSKDPCLRELSR